MIIRRPPGSLSSQSGQMSMQRPTCTLKTSIWSNGYTSTHGNPSEPSIYSYAYTLTYRFLRNVNVVKCVYHDIQEPVKCQFGQMNLRRHTGTRKMSIWSNEFPTTYRTRKTSIWSNEFTTTYRHPSNGQSGQMSIRRLTGALKKSICSNEYTTTYSYLQILNLVK